jgi:hypothetical protein
MMANAPFKNPKNPTKWYRDLRSEMVWLCVQNVKFSMERSTPHCGIQAKTRSTSWWYRMVPRSEMVWLCVQNVKFSMERSTPHCGIQVKTRSTSWWYRMVPNGTKYQDPKWSDYAFKTYNFQWKDPLLTAEFKWKLDDTEWYRVPNDTEYRMIPSTEWYRVPNDTEYRDPKWSIMRSKRR